MHKWYTQNVYIRLVKLYEPYYSLSALSWATGPLTLLENIAKVTAGKIGKLFIFWLSFFKRYMWTQEHVGQWCVKADACSQRTLVPMHSDQINLTIISSIAKFSQKYVETKTTTCTPCKIRQLSMCILHDPNASELVFVNRFLFSHIIVLHVLEFTRYPVYVELLLQQNESEKTRNSTKNVPF